MQRILIRLIIFCFAMQFGLTAYGDDTPGSPDKTHAPYPPMSAKLFRAASTIDYEGLAKAMRAGCALAQTNDSVPYPSAAVDLGSFFIITGKAKWLPARPSNPDSTIKGIDADGDCVRDDIEHYIAKKYPKKNQYKLRKYLYEYAAWMDRFLISGLNINTAKTSFNNMAAAGECIEREVSDGTATDIVDDLFAKFHNTFSRTERYLYNSRQTSGWTTRDEISISCP